MKRFGSALAFILLLASCGYFAKDIHLKREVAAKEVIGVWRLRDESLSMARKDSIRPYSEQPDRLHEIEIRVDGTCRFRSITQMPTDYLDCEGTWQLAHALNDKHVPQLDFTLKKGGGYGFSLDFTEEEGRLVLWEYWGDPDSWEFLKYDKKPN